MGFLINNKNQSVVTREVSGVNVGTIVEFPKGTTIPSSFLDANGSLYDPLVWVDLYKFLGTNRLPNAYAGEVRVGDVKWFQNRNSLPYGWVAADGATTIPFSDYPDVKPAMDSGRLVTVDEATYTSDVSKRASWAKGSTSFRTPDYNGKSTGNTFGGLVLRGDGLNASPVGTIQGDAIRNIKSTGGMTLTPLHDDRYVDNGLMRITGSTDIIQTSVGSTSNTRRSGALEFDASRVVPTAPENRVVNTAGCWAVCLVDPNIKAIKAAGFVDNDGLLSAVGVLKQVTNFRKDLESTNARFGKWYRSGTAEFNRLFGQVGSVWTLRDGELVAIETSTEFRIKGIIRGDGAKGAIGSFIQFKNPDKLQVYSPYSILDYSYGEMYPEYSEPVSSSGGSVNIGVASVDTVTRVWLMIDITIIKV